MDATLLRWLLALVLLAAGAVLLAVFVRVVRPAMRAGGPPDAARSLRRVAVLPAGVACAVAGVVVAVSGVVG